jgi:hypothetical protein
LLSLLQLYRCLHEVGARASTRIVAELLDPADVELGRVTAADDLIVSDELASLMTAQLAERPELDAVFNGLFDVRGAVVSLKPVEWYLPAGTVVFAACVAAARLRAVAGTRREREGSAFRACTSTRPTRPRSSSAPMISSSC